MASSDELKAAARSYVIVKKAYDEASVLEDAASKKYLSYFSGDPNRERRHSKACKEAEWERMVSHDKWREAHEALMKAERLILDIVLRQEGGS